MSGAGPTAARPPALTRDFYSRATPIVARELLGQVLAVRRADRWVGGVILETEAYLGSGDEASHSRRGSTPRSAVMFGPPGTAYVYLIYGVHHCFNAVTEPAGEGAAVLVRALGPVVPTGLGVDGLATRPERLRGPGLVCRELGIGLALNGADLVDGDELRIVPAQAVPATRVVCGPRVGISRSRELALRFRVGP